MKKLLYFIPFIFCISATCFAQEVIVSGEAMYNSNFSIINSAIGKSSVSKKKSNPAKKSTTAALLFTRNEALSKKIQQNFIAQLTKTQPSQKETLEKIFSANQLRNSFDNLLSGYGYSSRNLADVMTAYLVINWQVVNATEFNEKKGFDAVRKMIAETLTSSGKLSSTSNAERQTIAETFGYQAMIAMATYKNMTTSGNAGLPAFKEAVYKNTKAAGVDLKAYSLTADGFVKK